MLRTISLSKSLTSTLTKMGPRAMSTSTILPQVQDVPSSKLGGRYTVTLIPGDGIGQETASAVKTIFKAANVPVDWEQFDVSGYTSADDKTFKQSVESLRRNKVGLKGILYTPVSSLGHSSFNVTIRKDLDMYASLVLCKNIPGYPTRHEGVDFAIIRENTEGEYSGLEHQSYPGVVESLKVITRTKSERIARFAFDFALRNNRKKVTCIHKANIMKLADGLFLNTCRELVSKPQQFDVMVMPNLYGNIVSNVGAGLVGGPGIVPGCNIGREYAMFEPGCRHVGKDIQGRNTANPSAMILSSVMMLRHLGLDDHANKIANAVSKTIMGGAVKTPDMGGSSTTTDFTFAVISNL
ncbi:isocitrate dehydrogenase (NAD(+)) idh1 [Linnemannia schmuckeri]|uniref:isocitrate dehydrogenase (NAD(+)) n=1 Tax=Linnemannia schmuckeri TaxID=64567 RepID=A0A9P5S6S8_9FUNG|nr:isocitrate dehydrogenase (NAD(+)) idh1 [Linnemannia schmuckeri]